MRARDNVKLDKLTMVAREDEMQGLHGVSNLRKTFFISSIGIQGSCKRLNSNARSAFSSVPASTRARNGRDCWFQRSVASNCILGWVLREEVAHQGPHSYCEPSFEGGRREENGRLGHSAQPLRGGSEVAQTIRVVPSLSSLAELLSP